MTALPLPTDSAAPSDAATAMATAAVTPVPSPSPVETEAGVKAAEGIRDVVAEQGGGAAAGIVDTLDSIAIDVGKFHVSLWDAIVVALVLLAVWALAFFLARGSRKLLRRMTKLDLTQRLLAEKLVTIAVWAIAILMGIDILGIDLTALAVFSGAFGLAIGFGLQKTFGNLIAGIILLMDRSIKPGDVIAIADSSGAMTFGQIRKIGIRAVSLTTRDQREYLIPNENLMVNQVENWSYSSKNVRIQVPVGVSYSCDLKLAEKLMLEAARSATRVLTTPPPTVWLDAYADSSVNFVIHCWIDDPEEGTGNVRSDVLKRLWDLFAEAGVEIPFPQRDINLRDSAQFQQLVAAIAQRVEKPGAADEDAPPA
ncbi:mechanosensitive ion channel family protein [Tsuneonella amylolytica]|uniref:mechanosensitive ion channel family protein n=1 Tax=Tsuneonella amylolytica TaxID=2338327 RepID=UPI001F4795B8|nr:mechanosensitive ion channel domain-containing protein [Tsuneonella amylolytica]